MKWAGSCYFALKGATPSPLDAAALSRGSADPLSSTDPLPPLARTPPHHSAVRRRGPPPFCGPLPTIPRSVGADPLSSTDSPHHSVVSRRGPPPFYGLSPPFRRQSARTPSLLRTLPTIPSSVGADPLSPAARTPPHHSAVRRRGPPLSGGADPSPPFRGPSARTPSLLRTLPTIPSSVGADPSLLRTLPTIPSSVGADPLSPAARTPRTAVN
ncbi:hypothetical protein niasHT_028343 [Heterodera trifolii]|uniref:Uncharacterized protein n=1 Tax=Heterodera trifolii TaxID=157864 RepID=A0ABD2KSI5_9BILA